MTLGSDAAAGLESAGAMQSGVAIRFGSTGQRAFLDHHLTALATLPIDMSASDFGVPASQIIGGLNIESSQTVVPLWSGATIVGSVITQNYSITNISGIARSFEMVRYLNGLTAFGGGGRMPGTSDHFEMLFETNVIGDMHAPSSFIAIAAEGGTSPAAGRFEISAHSGLRSRIINGDALNDGIAGDMDYDQFIDTGHSANVALALRNVFTLDAGASDDYSTITVLGFGSLAVASTVPGPASAVLVGLGVLGLAGAKWRHRRPTAKLQN